jgi:hypothetical protein
LNAVSRFDANRRKRGRNFPGLPPWGQPALYAAGALVLVLLVFQLFFRYEYIQNNGALWRLDRLTQQMCQVNVTQAGCVAPKKITKFSSSTSTSTSTSTSLAVKPPKKHH